MNKYHLTKFLALLLIPTLLHAEVLSGRLTEQLSGSLQGNTYTSEKAIFTTVLPDIMGEMRDSATAVSVFSRPTSSQHSLEYHPLSLKDITKYQQIGDRKYLSLVLKESIIKSRYQPNFPKLYLTLEEMRETDDSVIYINIMHIPGASSLQNTEGENKDLVVALGALVHANKLFIFQVAKGNLNDIEKTTYQEITNEITEWARNTAFSS